MKNKTVRSADRDRLRQYYAVGQEATRLSNDDGWFERERTLALITERVESPADILDMGGGTGVHSYPLADLGHRVTLVDLSPKLVEIARQHDEGQLEKIVCADISKYSPEQKFDAVLCLGPGYHAGSQEEFAQVCTRVTELAKPGGWVFLSFIPRLTGVAGLVSRAAMCPGQVLPGTLTQIYNDGVFRNEQEDSFGEAYFAQPEEVKALFEQLHVKTDTLCSIRGFSAYYGTALRKLKQENEVLYQEVLHLTNLTASLPEVVSTCWHAMYIGRLP